MQFLHKRDSFPSENTEGTENQRVGTEIPKKETSLKGRKRSIVMNPSFVKNDGTEGGKKEIRFTECDFCSPRPLHFEEEKSGNLQERIPESR